jgi:putative Ca2+/H+ antiporter (TMEM165/GDT1 family)
VNLVLVFTTFVTIFPAELPDKTMVASLVLTARSGQPLGVWVGASTALVIHAALAVVAGGIIAAFPERLVELAAGILFAVGAVVLLREGDTIEDDEEGVGPVVTTTRAGAARTAFAVVFLAEWGDLTQLATASLAARSGDPLSVFLGSALALTAVAGVACLSGRALLRVLPVALLRRIAAAVFALLAVASLVAAIRG